MRQLLHASPITFNILNQVLTHIYFFSVQTVPACQNLYKNSFTYHCLGDEQDLQFDDAIQFLGECHYL